MCTNEINVYSSVDTKLEGVYAVLLMKVYDIVYAGLLVSDLRLVDQILTSNCLRRYTMIWLCEHITAISCVISCIYLFFLDVYNKKSFTCIQYLWLHRFIVLFLIIQPAWAFDWLIESVMNFRRCDTKKYKKI